MSQANTRNLMVWTDIPVANLDRAARFYAAVFELKVSRDDAGGTPFCVLEHTEGNGGCLVLEPEAVSSTGMLVYFNVDGRMRKALAAVAANGGKVIQPLHPIGPHGFRAIILDSEGNRMALHASADA